MVDFSSPTCFASDTAVGSNMLLLYAIFLFLAVLAIAVLRKTETPKSKIAIVYLHLIFLFMPIVLLSTNTACGFSCNTCHNNISLLLVYSIPLTVAVTLLFGIIAVPAYYTFSSRKINNAWIIKFIKIQSGRLRITSPDIRVYNSAKLLAFSFRGIKSKIFLSIGALEVLNQKETEAMILHELMHIKCMDSLTKLSQKLMRFSPFYSFVGFDNSDEEKKADSYASRVQMTDRYIKSVRKKIALFENEIRHHDFR